ncbi:zinc dependent phospholipase C family protein [Paenibacillus sp. NPDC058071]|uniref:zinc dependent phospholipase C family protein n=1 Tax=Paenibacillus sp. NPDC058071 TaxID=3346326 RepID=UPI0036DA401E
MPNIWTHLIFGQITLDNLREWDLITSDKTRQLFNMGCQGPDFLFYHRFLPWQKKSALNELGSEIHTKHCGPVIMSMLDYAKNRLHTEGDGESTVVYAIGFLLHHILDRHMHPFVYSRSGFYKYDHQRYEIMMDSVLAYKLREIETWKTPAWREITINGRFPKSVVDCFEEIAGRYYPVLASRIRREDWDSALRDMLKAQRLFHDPTGVKRIVAFGQIEPFVYRRAVPYDIWNESLHPWIDPTDKDIVHHDSGWMLWDHALADAITVTRSVFNWLRCEDPDENERLRAETETLIGNFSYDSGLPCESGLPIRYAEPIWPDESSIERPNPFDALP